MDKLLAILNDLHPEVDFTTEEALIDNSVLNSFDVVTIVAEVDDTFGVEIPAEELIPENFNSASALYALIQRLADN